MKITKAIIDPNSVKSLKVFKGTHTLSLVDSSKVARIKSSIRKNGFDDCQPVIVANFNGDLQIVSGRHRVWAAKEAGLKAIPALVVDHEDVDILINEMNSMDLERVASRIESDHMMRFDLDDLDDLTCDDGGFSFS